mmetsp:Transcript_32322/g.67805  ORF Transcript_32322/g.67805 Transcript_32322/m.67805 type:complete len:976 (-) Transcript_32322:11-2938(-)
MRLNKNNAILLALALCGVFAYVLDGQSYFNNDATSIKEVNRALSTPTPTYANGGPNVIYIQHESLSGSILLNTEEGKTSAPFFHDRMANDPNFYVFENHRTGSGNTIDAMPSLMTGCLPYTEKGIKYAHAKGRSIGYEFAKNGYSTASFSSRTLDREMSRGKWRMLYDMLSGGMDKVEEATRNKKLKLDNAQGSSDGQMLPLFEDWLAGLAQQEGEEKNPMGEGVAKKPFYAQFYNFNLHYPYLDLDSGKKEKTESLGDEYYSSLKTTDDFLKSLFDILSRTGQLENTIIVGSGDHGEDPFKYRYARLYSLNSHILHAAAYVYYPRFLMPHEGVAERLRRNTQQLSYTLDVYPTIRSILYGVSGADNSDFDDPNPLSDPDTAASKGCLTGVDLTSVDIPEDRVVLAMNLASSQMSQARRFLQLYGLITKDSALYHRKDRTPFRELKQERNNEYVLEFDSCTQSTTSLCMTKVTRDKQEYFRRAIVWLRKEDNVFFGKDVQNSELVKFFVGKIGGETAMSKTKEAMEIEHVMAMEEDNPVANVNETSMENLAAIVEAQDITDPLPDHSSKGSLLGLIRSAQKKMSWRTHDNPSCDGIFLYMPDMSASIENQLNNYILASMMATFMNLSMVIKNAPTDSEGIESSSPLGCPKDGKKTLPPVLSSLMKPPRWLSSKCPVPCKKTHGYSDWKNLRHAVCENDNGRQSKVFVMGGGETRDYFEKHFKGLMLQRPSPVARDWALRLRAMGKEADVFAQLNGEQIWDFLGALVARSNLLQFQPWILADVADSIKSSFLPVDDRAIKKGKYNKKTWEFDAMQVWSGDGLQSGPKTKHPIDHYLRHFKCSDKSPRERIVFIATNDRQEVMKGINDLGIKNEQGQYEVGCNTFRFRFYLPVKYAEADTSCAARYSRTVTDISRFLIFSNAETLVGDVDSDWGRLVRTFRLKLISGAKYDGDKSPVSLTSTEVASGTMPPARVPGL